MIDTHFTRRFGLLFPFAMLSSSGSTSASLAAIFSRSGGLGLISVEDESIATLKEDHLIAAPDAVGWAVSSSRLSADPAILNLLLSFRPRAILFEGSATREQVDAVRQSGARVMLSVDAPNQMASVAALDPDVVVAKCGSGDMPDLAFVPRVADELHSTHSEATLLVLGKISNARAISACLVMGADGIVLDAQTFLPQVSNDGEPNDKEIVAKVEALASRASRILLHAQRKLIPEE